VHGGGIAQFRGPADLFLEGPGIDRAIAKPSRVPRRGGDQDFPVSPGRTPRLKHTAQPGDIGLNGRVRARRSLASVEIFDDPVHGHNLPARRDQPSQDTPLPGTTDADRNAADGDLHRTEHPDGDH